MSARVSRSGPRRAMGDYYFAFCSGLENSYPVITDHRGQSLRRDGFELSRHYQRWRHDLELVAEMGLRFLRYGPPYYLCHQGPGKYQWEFADKTFSLLRKLRIEPIADLCHFGLPDWLGASFQNSDWPLLFGEYAQAFAERFPWVRLFTPVNEIMIAAEFSAKQGWWNERLKDDHAFVTALKHLCRANLMAQQAILKVRPDALFIQSESSEYFHSAVPEALHEAAFRNERRFAALDLCYGHPVVSRVYEFLCDNGMSAEEYHWFMEQAPSILPNCIMGSDYYITNEKKVIDAQGTAQGSGEVLGYYEITKQYYNRYKLPVFHTETNRKDEGDAARWLWKEFFNILKLRGDGLPIVGFTWYSFFDQTDWGVELREDNHRIDPMGLYDLERKIRPVGKVFRQIIADWQAALGEKPLHCQVSLTSGGHDGEAVRRRSVERRELGPIKPPRIKQEHSPKPRNRPVNRQAG